MPTRDPLPTSLTLRDELGQAWALSVTSAGQLQIAKLSDGDPITFSQDLNLEALARDLLKGLYKLRQIQQLDLKELRELRRTWELKDDSESGKD